MTLANLLGQMLSASERNNVSISSNGAGKLIGRAVDHRENYPRAIVILRNRPVSGISDYPVALASVG